MSNTFGMTLHELKQKFTPEELQAAFSQLTEKEAQALLHDWSFIGRPNQQEPPGDWFVHLILAGRGLT